MIKLRDNQIPAVKAGLDFFKMRRPDPSIIVAPTAYGKSICISSIAHQSGDKVLVLQPTRELLEQNYAKLVALGGEASIYSASMGVKEIGEITYATIGSIKNLGHKFKELGITKIIIDECHLYPREADGMLRIFLHECNAQHVLGFTATPLKLQSNVDRSGETFSKLVMLTSNSDRGNFFKEIIHITQIDEMLEGKYWSPLVYDNRDFNVQELELNSSKAEFTDESMKMSYKTQNIHDRVVDYIMNSDRQHILVAVPSVEAAQTMAQEIPNAAAVWGDMDATARKDIISEFRSGDLRVIINVNVLVIGFDYEGIDLLVSARPTASLPWWYQFVGRGTRISPRKKDCMVADFAGNMDRFGRVEFLRLKKDKQWKLYGEGGRLLTGIPVHEIGQYIEGQENEVKKRIGPTYAPGKAKFNFGKYNGKLVQATPRWYLKWAKDNVDWMDSNFHIYEEIQRILGE